MGLVGLLALGMLASAPAGADDATEAKKIFTQRCTACHTYGKGVKVGPDLKGVTERRPRAWLLQFVRSSQRVINSGDPVASALFQQFKQQRMPDWSDLSEAQVGAILDWFAANGPEKREIDERNADVATPAEIEAGRALFHGKARFGGGGAACAGCHAIRDPEGKSGASFGPDLTDSYLRYRDRALTLFFKRPCFPRQPESSSPGFLTPQESFDLKAYLRQAALLDESKRGSR
jgi:mono/diheme cytochrome c family protein